MADEKKPDDNGDNAKPETEPPPPHHEEEVSETSHSVTIAGKKIDYNATAGRLLLREEDGKKKASFFYTAYERKGVRNRAKRPIVFAFNGGPGSSSVWLHLGALGPKRVLLDKDGIPGPPPGRLVANEHSILDAADLVFIDPVGTGYSRAIPGDEDKEFHHFTKDIETVGEFIRIYLTRHNRWSSPKFLAGESYGTTRSAGLAGHLFRRHGIAFNGLLLISSILNFHTAAFDSKTWTFERGNDLPYVLFLPTYAAAAWYHKRLERKHQRKKLRKLLDEVEEFAATDYLLALIQGDALTEKRFTEIAARVAGYTGLEQQYVERYNLRIEIMRFCKALLRDQARTIGRIDARYVGIDRFTDGDAFESDPSLDSTLGPFTSALNDYVRSDLEYESELPYEIMSAKVHENWNYEDFKNAHVDVSETLREVMTRTRFMRVFVANGYFDLATPHFATEYTFNHLGLDPTIRDHVTMEYYEAGHMMYVHLPSLEKLGGDMRRFITTASK